jgi:hypothetical protein
VGDIGKRPAVDEGRDVLQGLNQVGLERVLEQHRHRPLSLQIPGGHRLTVVIVGDDYPGQPVFEVGDRDREAQNSHHLRCHGNIEAILPRHSIGFTSQTDNYLPKGTVVHIHYSLEDNPPGINVEPVSLLERIIQQSGQEIMGRRDRVEITGKVNIDLLHRNHLAVTSPRRSTLDPENRTERWFPQGEGGLLPDSGQGLGQSDRDRGLALPGGGGCDRGDQNQLSVPAILDPLPEIERDLGLILSVVLQILYSNPKL